MKRSIINRTFELFLAALIIGAFVTLIFNLRDDDRSIEIITEVPKQEIEVNRNNQQVTKPASPEEIALLFGWKKKVPVKNVEEVKEEERVPETEEPVEIRRTDKIKHLGHIVTANGKEYYFFKDIETDELFRLSIDSPDSGWSLEEIVEGGFILGHEDKKYFIKKNE
jgi:hypothetical protein